MKLYSVHCWEMGVPGERYDITILVAANNEDEAEDKALSISCLDCVEAEEEVAEIDGYRVKFEKIESVK